MGWLDDFTSGVEQITDVVEDVGELAGAVRGATQRISTPSGTPNLNVVATNIQAKIDAGETLTDNQVSNMKLCQSKGWVFYPPAGDTYALEDFSGGGTNAGIKQTGLFSDLVTGAATSAATAAVEQGVGGLPVPWWKGPGGGLQMPWNDPQVATYLKQFSLDDSYLRVYYRAPRGYVIVRDAQGRPFAVLRQIAKQFKLWRPAAKPPISATDWKNYKRSKQIEKKLIKIARPALRAHSRPAAATTKRR
jgi:hypothetical protein